MKKSIKFFVLLLVIASSVSISASPDSEIVFRDEYLFDEVNLNDDSTTDTQYIDVDPTYMAINPLTLVDDDWDDTTLPYEPSEGAGIYSQENISFSYDGGKTASCEEIGLCYSFDIYDTNDFNNLYPGEDFIIDFDFWVNETGTMVTPKLVDFSSVTLSSPDAQFDSSTLVVSGTGFSEEDIMVRDDTIWIFDGVLNPGDYGRITLKGNLDKNTTSNTVSFGTSLNFNFSTFEGNNTVVTSGPTSIINVSQSEITVDKMVSDENGDGYLDQDLNGVGEILNYTITFDNRSQANAYDYTYEDSLLALVSSTPGLTLVSGPDIVESYSYLYPVNFEYDPIDGTMYFDDLEAGNLRSGDYEQQPGDYITVTYGIAVGNSYDVGSDSLINYVYLDGTDPIIEDCDDLLLNQCAESPLLHRSAISKNVSDSDEIKVVENLLSDGTETFSYEVNVTLGNDFITAGSVSVVSEFYDGLSIVADSLQVYSGETLLTNGYDYYDNTIYNADGTIDGDIEISLIPNSAYDFTNWEDSELSFTYDVNLVDSKNQDVVFNGIVSDADLIFTEDVYTGYKSNEVITNLTTGISQELPDATPIEDVNNDLVYVDRVPDTVDPNNDLVYVEPDNVSSPNNDLVYVDRTKPEDPTDPEVPVDPTEPDTGGESENIYDPTPIVEEKDSAVDGKVMFTGSEIIMIILIIVLVVIILFRFRSKLR